MKPSRLRSVAALAFALATFTSSCSRLFSVQSEVSVKKVPINLAFGLAPKVKGVQFAAAPDLPPVLDLPAPRLPPELPAEEEDSLCPPVSAIGARDPAPASMNNKEYKPEDAGKDNGNIPREGTYLFRFIGNYEGKAEHTIEGGVKTIEAVGQDAAGFKYFLSDDLPKLRMILVSHPLTETSGTDDGFYLREIDVPKDEEVTKVFGFRPGSDLKILDYPIEPGAQIISSAPDVAVKGDQGIVPNPLGGFLPTPGRSTITSTITVGARELIDVCSELAQAWKVNWKLEVTGGYNILIVGSFWLATAYGGWPIKDDYIIDGDLIRGNFASNLMRLDPGDFA